MTLAARVIPALTLSDGYLVKTVGFAKPQYIGDPINAVRIFNDKEVDEVVLCDIGATVNGSGVSFDLLGRIASEAFMPLGYGGGIDSVQAAVDVLSLGFEKIILGSVLHSDSAVVSALAERVGSQSVVASVDVGPGRWGRPPGVFTRSGSTRTGATAAEWAVRAVALGAGEILLNSIARDGTRTGYDLDTIRAVVDAVNVPVVALGGAGSVVDLRSAIEAGASAAAAGSLFVQHGKHKAVLITYPSPVEVRMVSVLHDR